MDKRDLQIVLKLKDEASKEISKISNNVGSASGKTNAWGKSFEYVASAAKMASVAIGVAGVAGVTYGINVASQLQTAEVGLTTLLGSSEDAAKTVERLKEEAKRTPFELPGLTQATQLLTSITKDGDKSIDIILDVGEALAAMGKGQAELDRIIINLQQIASVGKASMLDIKQFAFAGIPIFEMLTEQTGLTGEALGDLISDGGVSFDLLTKMFDKANDEGGKFFNAFKNQSGTFAQASSNMKDSLGIFFSDFVKNTGLFDGLTQAMITASDVLGNYEEILANSKQSISNFFNVLDEKTGLITLMKDAWNDIVALFTYSLTPVWLEFFEAIKPLKPFLDVFLVLLSGGLIQSFRILIDLIMATTLVIIKLSTVIVNIFVKAFDIVTDSIANAIIMVEKFIDGIKTAIGYARQFASSVGSKIGSASDVAKNVFDTITGRASGGPVSGGTPYMVGEQGPELFVPRQSGNIIPNGAGAGAMVNVVVNGDVSGSEVVEKVQNAIMESLRLNNKLNL